MGARRRRTEEEVEAEWELGLPEHHCAPSPAFRVLAAS